jgi:glycosyltransferase involved in cell wall biosynthesis
MEWIARWPPAKGVQAYFIRAHEIHNGNVERVRATYRMPVLKLVIATWLKRVVAEEYGDPNAVIVPNGVDRAQFVAPPRGKGAPPTVGMLYSPNAWKGAATAFEAVRIVQQARADLKVVAFGSQPLDPAHRPPANFEYHLRPPQHVIPDLYRRCDCWVISSTTEGFGMPGIEAAACRCPLVSTRCGGPEDYIEEGVNGFLVPVGDAVAMAKRIGEVLALDAGRWSEMSDASHRIAGRFDWDRSAATLDAALNEAVFQTHARRPLRRAS